MDRGVGVLQLSRLSETGTLGPPRQGAHPADGMHDTGRGRGQQTELNIEVRMELQAGRDRHTHHRNELRFFSIGSSIAWIS